MQAQAEMGPGREAAKGEGGGVMASVKGAATVGGGKIPGRAGQEERCSQHVALLLSASPPLPCPSGCLHPPHPRPALPQSAMDTVKELNPATRDMKEGHC